jgi:hypothetical protein
VCVCVCVCVSVAPSHVPLLTWPRSFLLRRHCACIVREDPERLLPGERIIMCGALVETDAEGVPLVLRTFPLVAEAARVAFLDRYRLLASSHVRLQWVPWDDRPFGPGMPLFCSTAWCPRCATMGTASRRTAKTCSHASLRMGHSLALLCATLVRGAPHCPPRVGS